jgi:hypothetical protein
MAPTPILPFWFKQRQCKAEPAGSDTLLKVSGPNLGETYLHIDPVEDGRWRAGLRLQPAGEDVALSQSAYDNPRVAWDVAFELFRTHFIV